MVIGTRRLESRPPRSVVEAPVVRPRPDYVTRLQTTLPRWEPPTRVGATDGKWLVYLSGHEAAALVEGEPASIRDLTDADDVRAIVARDLARATAGTRILAVGPELFVALVGACARECGAIDAELVLIPTDLDATAEPGAPDEGPRPRRVFCAACTDIFVAEIAIGDATACPACGTLLVVHYLYSRELAAVIGQHHRADPEKA